MGKFMFRGELITWPQYLPRPLVILDPDHFEEGIN